MYAIRIRTRMVTRGRAAVVSSEPHLLDLWNTIAVTLVSRGMMNSRLEANATFV
jgi:hypothetical protein